MTEQPLVSARSRRALWGVAALGAVGFAAGAFYAPERAWPGLLVNAFYFLSLALGGALFVSIQHVSNAAWATAVRRVPEALMSYLLPGALLLLAVFFGRRWVYGGWVGVDFGLGFKNAWLSTPFFFARMAVILGAWALLASLLRRESRRQDEDGSLAHTAQSKKYSAAFLAVFAVTVTLASFDWLMSVEPLFYSTIYAFYVIAGILLSGVAAITLVVVALRGRGLLPQVNETHLHNLGRLLFGFATFWAYIWLCQYILVYYANLPEETVYYYRRTETAGWNFLFLLNVLLNWVVPFVALLPRVSKRSGAWLAAASAAVLLGHWVDLYVLVFPGLELSPLVSLAEAVPFAGFAALFLLSFERGARGAAWLPKRDPYLAESLWQEAREEGGGGAAWSAGSKRALALSTVGFALTFAVWGLVGALAPLFRERYGLTAFQTSLLIAVPVLLGSVGRLPMGILADRFGGRFVFGSLLVFCLVPAFGASLTGSYASLLAWGFLLGCAGTSFSVGVAFASRWFRPEEQGTALGVYGTGNIGQSLAVFGAPALVAATGDWRVPFWAFGAAAGLFGVVFLLLARNAPAKTQPKSFGEYLSVLRRGPMAWVLSLFYFLTFGGFVALGIYLPTLLKDIFGLSPTDAGARTAGFVVMATLMRPVGGWLADRHGGAPVLSVVRLLIAAFALGLTTSTMVLFTVGALGTAAMLGLGNGAVFKLVPEYFPAETGTVTGLVGAAGGLGGFFPPLVLGVIKGQTGSYDLGFLLLSGFAVACAAVNFAVFLRGRVRRAERALSH